MRKSTLFISVVLTTFMLAVMFGVVSAYQRVVSSTETAAVQSQPVVTANTAAAAEMVSQPVAAVVPTQVVPTQAANIAPEAAAALAGKVLGRTDMYSVEVTQFEGADAYLVTFSSGDLVYLSLDGQILSISKLPVTTIVQKGSKRNSGDNQTTAVVSSGGEGGGEHQSSEHEGGDN